MPEIHLSEHPPDQHLEVAVDLAAEAVAYAVDFGVNAFEAAVPCR
jgi:hypothetical protein